jgi:chorismate dehydratase
MTQLAATSPTAAAAKVRRIGCVSFLNARPLIDGLDGGADPLVRFDVPSRLLGDLEAGEVDIALCPVIDLQRSRMPLVIVPAGGIGCDGPTLTVRLYSRVPIDRIRRVHVDSDSHTSVALLRVLMQQRHGLRPELVEYKRPRAARLDDHSQNREAMLLIGDKVVTSAPPAEHYPHQVDLGEAWKTLTGMPFVFAVWMTRQGTELGDLPVQLDETRRRNARRIDTIVDRHAGAIGWPRELALRYLGQWLKYEIGPRQLSAIDSFFHRAHQCGVIDKRRPIELHPMPDSTPAV